MEVDQSIRLVKFVWNIEEQEGVDYSRYLKSYWEQQSFEEESYGYQIREIKSKMYVVVLRGRLGSEEDDKGR